MFPRRTQGLDVDPEPEEETPLLHKGNVPRTETHLPVAQVAILLLVQLSEPITFHSIRPYINQVRSPILIGEGIGNVRLSLSVSCQSLMVTKQRSDTTQG